MDEHGIGGGSEGQILRREVVHGGYRDCINLKYNFEAIVGRC
jgi:hypothetical protein